MKQDGKAGGGENQEERRGQEVSVETVPLAASLRASARFCGLRAVRGLWVEALSV